MRKSKVFINVATLFAVLVSVVFISCGALFENGQSGNVTINLPPISSRARAISSDKISDLKTATTSYRVTVSGMTREGAGGAFTFTLPVGVVAEITVECLNSSGNTIVRAKKMHTVIAGANNVDIILSQDGEVVETDNTPTAPQPVRTVLYSDGKFIINELPQNRRSDVDVTKEYEAMKDDGSNYVFSSNTNVPWYGNRASITSVEIGSPISPTSTAYWFYYASNCNSINLTHLDTSNVTNMGSMFAGCKLTSLDVSNFDTSSVTNMVCMFESCSGLTSLDVSRFDTSKVTNMGNMFNNCSGLTSLDVSNFDTSSVTNMACMFRACTELANLDVSRFDTAKVTYMIEMFYNCPNLTSIDVSNFDTSNVENMSDMFGSCSKVTSLDVSNFDTSNVTDMTRMFYSCSKLTTIYASTSFVTDSVTSDSQMFYNCPLVGGLGTRQNDNNVDKTYARIDGGPNSDTPGYFTDIANKP